MESDAGSNDLRNREGSLSAPPQPAATEHSSLPGSRPPVLVNLGTADTERGDSVLGNSQNENNEGAAAIAQSVERDGGPNENADVNEYTCPDCEKTYKILGNLVRHRKNNKLTCARNRKKQDKAKVVSNEKKNFYCSRCQTEFSKKRDVLSHIRYTCWKMCDECCTDGADQCDALLLDDACTHCGETDQTCTKHRQLVDGSTPIAMEHDATTAPSRPRITPKPSRGLSKKKAAESLDAKPKSKRGTKRAASEIDEMVSKRAQDEVPLKRRLSDRFDSTSSDDDGTSYAPDNAQKHLPVRGRANGRHFDQVAEQPRPALFDDGVMNSRGERVQPLEQKLFRERALKQHRGRSSQATFPLDIDGDTRCASRNSGHHPLRPSHTEPTMFPPMSMDTLPRSRPLNLGPFAHASQPSPQMGPQMMERVQRMRQAQQQSIQSDYMSTLDPRHKPQSLHVPKSRSGGSGLPDFQIFDDEMNVSSRIYPDGRPTSAPGSRIPSRDSSTTDNRDGSPCAPSRNASFEQLGPKTGAERGTRIRGKAASARNIGPRSAAEDSDRPIKLFVRCNIFDDHENEIFSILTIGRSQKFGPSFDAFCHYRGKEYGKDWAFIFRYAAPTSEDPDRVKNFIIKYDTTPADVKDPQFPDMVLEDTDSILVVAKVYKETDDGASTTFTQIDRESISLFNGDTTIYQAPEVTKEIAMMLEQRSVQMRMLAGKLQHDLNGACQKIAQQDNTIRQMHQHIARLQNGQQPHYPGLMRPPVHSFAPVLHGLPGAPFVAQLQATCEEQKAFTPRNPANSLQFPTFGNMNGGMGMGMPMMQGPYSAPLQMPAQWGQLGQGGEQDGRRAKGIEKKNNEEQDIEMEGQE